MNKLIVPNADVKFRPNLPKAKKVVGVRPSGSLILIEKLTAQEITSDIISVSDKVDAKYNEARILAFGPRLDPETVSLQIGDRVLLQGTYIPVPNPENDRERGVVEIHNIKAVLVEEE